MKYVSKTVSTMVLALILAGTAGAQGAKGARKMPAVKVPCGKVVTVNDVIARKYNGKISAYSSIHIVTRVSGYLQKTCFKEGDIIKKGDLLYLIEDINYKAALDAAEARLKQIESEVEYTQKQYERNNRLRKQDAVAEKTQEDSVRAYHYAQAKLAEAKANLIAAKTDYGYTKIYAPINGRIGPSQVSTFNYITPATGTLVTIVRFDPIYAVFSISERDYYDMFSSRDDLMKNGRITVELPNGTFYKKQGIIEIIDNVVDSETGTLMLWGVVDNPNGELNPGSLVNVILSKNESKKVTAVTPTALLTDAAGSYVFVVENGKTFRRNVKLGTLIGDKQIISSGLKAGETIVVDGVHKVFNGGEVIPLFEGKAK